MTFILYRIFGSNGKQNNNAEKKIIAFNFNQ